MRKLIVIKTSFSEVVSQYSEKFVSVDCFEVAQLGQTIA
jgi:hypothetical protein